LQLNTDEQLANRRRKASRRSDATLVAGFKAWLKLG
jgi:hypothetical protein